eukprot:CAMPEP_0201479990 /NCGR_PEP_ID=MMETSP0151_2-20130828/4590_1 /ASSEMBLY_ACC=CAM_ASM_000257 /TAXON_ID=200890 /ORGANISM="Paramoeba atlantica, Strain 621/1 / CCAP 1560/9" /LENGTH=178 /DNA_ID=CAMNT_0047861729 /DNA_START=13 /DNA_END=546 /DNA_ORIENTATION=+
MPQKKKAKKNAKKKQQHKERLKEKEKEKGPEKPALPSNPPPYPFPDAPTQDVLGPIHMEQSYNVSYLQVPGAMKFPSHETSNILAVQEMMGRGARVRVEDGRLFEGLLVCTDHENNVILRNTEEFRSFYLSNEQTGEKKEIKESNMIGLVTIPGKSIVKLEVSKKAIEEEEEEEEEEE